MEKVNEGARPTCLKLARKGEVLCLQHKFVGAIAALLEALALGTDNLNILSVIYCQLGISYYAIYDFQNAYKYNCYDAVASRLMDDKISECRAYGNIGIVLKAQNLFAEAIMFTKRQLAIAKAIKDKHYVAQGLYSLAAVYVQRAKLTRSTRLKIPRPDGNTCAECWKRSSSSSFFYDLKMAFTCYGKCVGIYIRLADPSGCGRVYGCMGNVLYLFGDYSGAIEYYGKRLSIASEFDDKEGQYIAYINIGNACVQLCNSNEAMRYYKAALELAVEISSRSRKSKCYFCLTKAAYNIQDYHRAEMYCLSYLALARELNDFTSMSRAYHWLARVYSKLGDYPKAAYFLACFRALAVEIRDENLATVAVESLKQLVMQHGCFVVSEDGSVKFDSSRDPEPQSHVCLVRTVSGSKILTFTNEPISELVCSNGTAQEERHDLESAGAAPRNSEDAFLDLVSRVQSSRLDEQRCDISIMSSRTVAGRRKTDGKMVTPNGHRHVSCGECFMSLLRCVFRSLGRPRSVFSDAATTLLSSNSDSSLQEKMVTTDCENNANIEEVFTVGEAFDSNVEQSLEREKCHCAKKNMHDPESRRSLVDPVLGAQATKMNEQPAMLLPGLKIEKENLDIINKLRCTSEEGVDSKIDEALIDLLMNAQEQRMNDQRSDPVTVINSNYVDCVGSLDEFTAEEELSVTVMRMQAGRLEDQRARLKTTK